MASLTCRRWTQCSRCRLCPGPAFRYRCQCQCQCQCRFHFEVQLMTLEELELSLPNGLHDARLLGVDIDYGRAEARMRFDVEVSDLEGGAPRYRRAWITFTGLVLFAIDTPAILMPSGHYSAVDSGPGQPSTSQMILPRLPEGVFLNWFFVRESNSFIRVAAKNASLAWLE